MKLIVFLLVFSCVSQSVYAQSTAILEMNFKKKVKDLFSKEMKEWEDGGRAEEAPIMKRDVHIKSNACVKARFTVKIGKNIPKKIKEKLKVGIFSKEAAYPAVIRYSNGSQMSDLEPDARGMAIKIAGITEKEFGKKLLERLRGSETQDFLLMTGRSFFLDSATDYIRFSLNKDKFLKQCPLCAKNLKTIFRWGASMVNPLTTEYQSAVPFTLGDKGSLIDPKKYEVVKYAARPCDGWKKSSARKIQGDYLTNAMIRSLDPGGKGKAGCYKFMVQFKPNYIPEGNGTMDYKEAQYPFYEVAEITIPKQNFTTSERVKFCEDLSMNPWKTIAAHAPLGKTNEVRKTIYKAISSMRQIINLGDVPLEPTVDDLESLK